MNKVTALLIGILFVCNCDAQFYIEPILGYQKDLNKNSKLKQLNTAINICWKVGPKYELILQVQRSWPSSYKSTDPAYTTNPALPVYAAANKSISPSALSLLIGHRIKLAGRSGNNSLFVNLSAGVSDQQIKVDYSYDKNNYTILNPDKTVKETGLYLSGGIEYMRNLKTGRIITQLLFGGFIHEEINYPNSFYFLVPFSFNVGYSIPIFKKNKHDEK
jgi:hypothetical protein